MSIPLGRMKADYGIFTNAASLTPPPIPEAVSFQQAYEKALMNAEAAAQAKHKTKEMDLGNIIKTAQAKYAEPMQASTLKAQDLANQFLERFGPQEHMAGLALQNAQAAQARAHGQYYQHQMNLPMTDFGKAAIDIENAKIKYGPDSAVVKQMERDHEDEQKALTTKRQYQEKLISTADRRAATPFGKLQMDRAENDAGFLVGSNYTIPISEEEQRRTAFRLDQQERKLSTDTKARERLLFAKNIDKTLMNIDEQKLLQFSGIPGNVLKLIEQGKDIAGAGSEKYREYGEQAARMKFLSKQIRQFYGDSIQPHAVEKIERMADPSYWAKSPQQALTEFRAMKDLLLKETETYKDEVEPFFGENKNKIGAAHFGYNEEGKAVSNAQIKSLSDQEILERLRGS